MVAPIVMFMTGLACAGTLITDAPTYICPTDESQPTVTVLAGTATPTPSPPATPYVIQPPADFYRNDDVVVGAENASLRLRFRLQDVTSEPAPPLNGESRSLYTWSLEIKNLGSVDYETIPTALMTITTITTANGDVSGSWGSSLAAMDAAGLIDETYDPITPGSNRVYQLAAHAPAGTVQQLAYLLDGANNRITWVNATNPHCGD